MRIITNPDAIPLVTVRVDMSAEAIFHVAVEFAMEFLAVRVCVCALSMHFALKPLSSVVGPAAKLETAVAVFQVAQPLTLVCATVLVLHHAMATALALNPLAVIGSAAGIVHRTTPVPLIGVPVTLVLVAIFIHACALTAAHAVLHVALKGAHVVLAASLCGPSFDHVRLEASGALLDHWCVDRSNLVGSALAVHEHLQQLVLGTALVRHRVGQRRRLEDRLVVRCSVTAERRARQPRLRGD